MSSTAFEMPDGQTPTHISFDEDADILGALMPNGVVHLWRWLAAKGKRPSGVHLGSYTIIARNDSWQARQIAIIASEQEVQVSLLVQDVQTMEDSILEAVLDLSEAKEVLSTSMRSFEQSLLQVFAYHKTFFAQSRNGRILTSNNRLSASFPEPCTTVRGLDSMTFLGLSESGRLYLNSQVLTSGCSSFEIGGDFLVYTTLQHEARFVLIETLLTAQGNAEDIVAAGYTHALPANGQNGTPGAHSQGDVKTGYARRVERGSRIVTIVPSSMSVVLQMPRGNLETIAPRPLVLQVVRGYLNDKEYREAFLVCRRHRIDLNILCDHDRSAFLQDLGLFVDQIDSVEYLNLFISGLKWVILPGSLYSYSDE